MAASTWYQQVNPLKSGSGAAEMRHTPYESEYRAIQTMGDRELLEYFLTRCFETDEIWYLQRGPELYWLERGGQRSCLVWPYKRLASEAALDYWQDGHPEAQALEDFLEGPLLELIAQNLMVEIMPRGGATGCLIAPGTLRSIFRGMMDAGEYRLDG